MTRRRWEGLRERFRAVFQRGKFEADLEEELRYHLDEATRRHLARGLSHEDARVAAARQLGSVAATKDAVRAETGVQPLYDLTRDLRQALRLVVRRPGFSAAVVMTMAIGVAANAAIFTVVHGVLLSPLPFPDAGRIVRLFNAYPGANITRSSTSLPEYLDRRTGARTLTDLALYREESNTIDSATGGRHAFALRVTPSFFSLLGLQAAHGRVFAETDEAVGAPPVVIITDDLWQTLGSPIDLAATPLRLDGTAFTIVGVLPSSFRFPSWAAQVLTPITIRPEDAGLRMRHTDGFEMLGRLAPGASLPEANAEIQRLNDATIAAYPAELHRRVTEAGYTTRVEPYLDDMTREVRTPLLVLWIAGLVVLATAVANVATLLLLRTHGRSHELTVRAALGAGRYRIARQLAAEVAMLVGAGGGLGYLGASAALRLLAAFEVYEIPRVDGLAAGGVAAGWTLASIVLCMVVTTAITIASSLRQSNTPAGSGRVTPSARWPHHVLVGGQLAFAVMLAMTAGVLIASLRNLQKVDPGFDPRGVSVAALIVPGGRYPTPQARAGLIARVVDAIETTPGVARAAAVSQLPFSGSTSRMPFTPDSAATPDPAIVTPYSTTVSDGYFETMGIRLIAGRPFQPADSMSSERVAVIDEVLARRYWPAGALGRQFRSGQATGELRPVTIVGVVAAVHQQSLRDRDFPGAVYLPMAQFPSFFMRLAVKDEGARDWPAVVRQIATVDAGLVPFWTDTLENSVASSLLFQDGPMQLVSLFAGVSLLLGAIGVYGVLAHEFAARQREVAVRLSLGGSRRHIAGLLSRRWCVVIGCGMLAGLLGAFGSTRIVRGLLFDVTPTSPALLITVTTVLLAVAALAGLAPLRRALRTDPATALRRN